MVEHRRTRKARSEAPVLSLSMTASRARGRLGGLFVLRAGDRDQHLALSRENVKRHDLRG
jgi:hypothetical protein